MLWQQLFQLPSLICTRGRTYIFSVDVLSVIVQECWPGSFSCERIRQLFFVLDWCGDDCMSAEFHECDGNLTNRRQAIHGDRCHQIIFNIRDQRLGSSQRETTNKTFCYQTRTQQRKSLLNLTYSLLPTARAKLRPLFHFLPWLHEFRLWRHLWLQIISVSAGLLVAAQRGAAVLPSLPFVPLRLGSSEQHDFSLMSQSRTAVPSSRCISFSLFVSSEREPRGFSVSSLSSVYLDAPINMNCTSRNSNLLHYLLGNRRVAC